MILLGWRINAKHFWLGKTIEISSLDKNPILLMLAGRFKPTAFHSWNARSATGLPSLPHHNHFIMVMPLCIAVETLIHGSIWHRLCLNFCSAIQNAVRCKCPDFTICGLFIFTCVAYCACAWCWVGSCDRLYVTTHFNMVKCGLRDFVSVWKTLKIS